MPDEKQTSPTRSLYALDGLNFFNAGIQTGLGPFIAIFYASERRWNPGQVGTLLAAQALSGVVVQAWMGAKVDRSHHKRWVSAVAAAVVTLSAIGIALLKSFGSQIAMQVAIGIAVTVFPAVTSALAPGLVDGKEFSQRIGRNEKLTHSGNIIFAVIAGLLGEFTAVRNIFFAAAGFASGMVFSSVSVREQEVNQEAARGGQQEGKNKGLLDTLRDRKVLIFAACIVLFNAGNSATLPLVGQLLSESQKSASVWQTAASILVAEIVMVAVAGTIGMRVDGWGRRPVFLAAFAILAVRNGLAVVSHEQWYLISLQALDGFAMAIYGVLLAVVAADLAAGTGRFNFLQGALQAAMGLGGFLSSVLFGWIAHMVSYNASFLGLALVAAVGGLVYWWEMPETRQGEEGAS